MVIQIVKLYFIHSLACNQGDIRLVGSTSSLEGRVEMCYDGVWGTVCSDYWETVEASVVCRQLGYSSSGMAAFTK